MTLTLPRHELLLLDSRAAGAPSLVARILAALRRGDRVVLHLSTELADAVITEVGQPPGLTSLPIRSFAGRPSNVLAHVLGRATADARQGRRTTFLGEPPVYPEGAWWEWLRVEAAANLLLPPGDTAVCVYQRDQLSDAQVADLLSTHPQASRGDEPQPSQHYEDPERLLRQALTEERPAEQAAPWRELVDPTLAEAREAARQLARSTDVANHDVDALIFALTEVLTNAQQHGQPPVIVRQWAAAHRLTASVTDHGQGPTDPLVGLTRPGGSAKPQDGLWLAHSLADVRHVRTEAGYTAWVVVGQH